MSHNFAILKANILAMSRAKTWERALDEWYLENIQMLDAKKDPPATCACSHHPIYELCWMRNSVTGAEALVGNVCVTRFIYDKANRINHGLKRIADDPERGLNEAAADWLLDRGILNEWEHGFCLDTQRKQRLSGRQWAKRDEINRMVLRRVAENASAAQRRAEARRYVGRVAEAERLGAPPPVNGDKGVGG